MMKSPLRMGFVANRPSPVRERPRREGCRWETRWYAPARRRFHRHPGRPNAAAEGMRPRPSTRSLGALLKEAAETIRTNARRYSTGARHCNSIGAPRMQHDGNRGRLRRVRDCGTPCRAARGVAARPLLRRLGGGAFHLGEAVLDRLLHLLERAHFDLAHALA